MEKVSLPGTFHPSDPTGGRMVGIESNSYKYIDLCNHLLSKLEVLSPKDPEYKEYYFLLEQAISKGMTA